MTKIKQFEFTDSQLGEITDYISSYGAKNSTSWPTVYILSSFKHTQYTLYIGESHRINARINQHLHDPNKRGMKLIHIITDDDFNQSVCRDLESHLIRWLSGSGYILKNNNDGLSDLDYPQAPIYRQRFKTIWSKLQDGQIVDQNIEQIENSVLFKYSPYKSLTAKQTEIAENLFDSFKKDYFKDKTAIVEGEPGTGKTILATYLIKKFKDQNPELKIALVIPMVQLRNSLKKVFRSIMNLTPQMVISPFEVTKTDYDILIVDETHRLKRRVNLPHYSQFDKTNQKLGLKKQANQLEWIVKQSKSQIFLYDPNQSIQPSDIRPEFLAGLKFTNYELDNQIRIRGGRNYTNYIKDILNNLKPIKRGFNSYDFRLFNDFKEMEKEIRKRDREFGLSRMIAGYAWPWLTKKDPNLKYDFSIEGCHLKWNNLKAKDWPNSDNAINEVGCVHTIQGYDLNYAAVIIGSDLIYDDHLQKITINPKNYYDVNGQKTASHDELERYIKNNIYNILLTRGIRGTYVYVVDLKLRQYLSNNFF